MSSSGIVPINGGSVILRTYLDDAAENTYLLGQYDNPVPPNKILVTSTNGLLISTTTINVSSVGTSSIFANTISTNQLFISTIYYSTFTSSQLNYPNTVVNNLYASTITFITMKGNTISSQNVVTKTLAINQASLSTLTATSLVTSTITVDQLAMVNGTFSTLNGTNMTLSTLSTIFLTIAGALVGVISSSYISCNTINANVVNVGTDTFSNATGNVLITSSLNTFNLNTTDISISTINIDSFSASYVITSSIYHRQGIVSTVLFGSTTITSTLHTPNITITQQSISSAIGSTISISTLTASTLYGPNESFDTLLGGSISTTNMLVDSITTSSIQFSTMYGVTATIPLIYASTMTLSQYIGSTLTVSTITASMTRTSSVITSTISVNTYYVNQAVYGQTIKKDSIDVFTNVTLNTIDCMARLDNSLSTTQTYTFGSTIQNQWIAAGIGAGIGGTNLATSNNGITWSGITVGTLLYIYGIIWTGNQWVATGFANTDSIATSPNGIDWTGRGKTLQGTGSSPTATMTTGRSVYYFVGTLYVTGSGSGSIGYSVDNGTTWYNITGSSGIPNAFGFAFNGIKAVVVGNGTNNSIAWSDESFAWNPIAGSNAIITPGYGVIWTGRQWVACGEGANRIIYSLDGITWTGSASGNNVFSTSVGPTPPAVYGLGWNGTMMIAVGFDNTNTIAYSMDEGYTWVGLGKTIFTTYGFSVTWNGQMWVATGYGTNTIAYSYNGINWVGCGASAINDTGLCVAFNFRRPYRFYFNNNPNAQLGSITGSNFPVSIPAGSQLDVVSESYYNGGYTNFSAAFQTHAS